MYPRILVAIDGSDTAERALDSAVDLAKALGSQLRIIFVADEMPVTYDLPAALLEETRKMVIKEGKAILKKARLAAKAAGVEADASLIEAIATRGRVAEFILKDAEASRANLIVVGTHGRRGVSRFFLGSVAQDVVRGATMPVLVISGERTGMPLTELPIALD